MHTSAGRRGPTHKPGQFTCLPHQLQRVIAQQGIVGVTSAGVQCNDGLYMTVLYQVGHGLELVEGSREAPWRGTMQHEAPQVGSLQQSRVFV